LLRQVDLLAPPLRQRQIRHLERLAARLLRRRERMHQFGYVRHLVPPSLLVHCSAPAIGWGQVLGPGSQVLGLRFQVSGLRSWVGATIPAAKTRAQDLTPRT